MRFENTTPSTVIWGQILTLAAILAIFSSPLHAAVIESTCYGTTANGRLKNGVKLPVSGPNFESYTSLGSALGRTWVHNRVILSSLTAAL